MSAATIQTTIFHKYTLLGYKAEVSDVLNTLQKCGETLKKFTQQQRKVKLNRTNVHIYYNYRPKRETLLDKLERH